MKRAILKFVDGEYVNVQANYIDMDDKYISIHLDDVIVGVFQLEYVKAAYISEKEK